jgi:hypothetical protein
MALKLKEFDFKQFLLEKGERVGLYAAGGIAVLMVVLSLFLPGKGLLSPSPRTSALEITDGAKSVQNTVSTKRPNETEAKLLRDVDPQLQKQGTSVTQDPEPYRLFAELFAPREVPSNKRQNPTVLGPEEFKFAVVAAQVSEYMFQKQGDTVVIGILEDGRSRISKMKNPGDRFKGMFGGGGMGGPGGGGGPGMPGMGGGGDNRGKSGQFGSGPPGGGGGAFGGGDDRKKGLEVTYVRKDELAQKQDASFARDLLPVHMAIVTGSFPLKQQIEDFQKALRAENAYQVVFQEKVNDAKTTKDGFSFAGFLIERRAIGPDGQVVRGPDGNEWQPVDLESPNSPYRALAALVNNEFAPEDPEVNKLLVPRLFLPRPVQVPVRASGSKEASKAYPDPEKELPKIKETLKALTPKQELKQAASKFDDGAFNPFDTGESAPDPRGGKDTPPASQEWEPPAYCVMRFLDVTIQPGQSYEYRLKVRMQNPNWNKPENEVANHELTKEKLLVAPEWTYVTGPDHKPLRVTVPSDLAYYAVDQQAIDNAPQPGAKVTRNYKGMNANVTHDSSRQVVVQIHRWKDFYEHTAGTKTNTFPIGDWVVGERMFALRGEFLGVKPQPTHVPIWSPEQSALMLAGKPPTRSRDLRATADDFRFLEPKRAPLVVDFEGGTATYRRGAAPAARNDDGTPVEGAKATPGVDIKAPAAVEIVLLTPDGRLVARNGGRDEQDSEREERLKEYRRHVDEAEGKEEAKPTKPGGDSPFGGGK